MKILIAYDGSECADAALADLRRAGLPRVAEALLLSVTETWLPPRNQSAETIVAEARAVRAPADLKTVYAQDSSAVRVAGELAEAARARIQALFPAWQTRAVGAYGVPASEVIGRAADWPADLIVVGSHGRAAFGRLLLGSVSQKVVTEARCSVRVARGRGGEAVAINEPARILLGVDGSPGADAAVRAVAARDWPDGSEVRLMTVVAPYRPQEAAIETQMTNVMDLQLVARSALQRAGLTVLPLIVEGDPQRLLVREAEAWAADAIFVGARGLRGFERYMLGSVSAAVAANAHCSVEVARAERRF